MIKFFKISIVFLLVVSYTITFPVLSVVHHHVSQTKHSVVEMTLHAVEHSGEKTHSPSCLICLRIHSSQIILSGCIGFLPALTSFNPFRHPFEALLVSAHYTNCDERAPPSFFS